MSAQQHTPNYSVTPIIRFYKEITKYVPQYFMVIQIEDTYHNHRWGWDDWVHSGTDTYNTFNQSRYFEDITNSEEVQWTKIK